MSSRDRTGSRTHAAADATTESTTGAGLQCWLDAASPEDLVAGIRTAAARLAAGSAAIGELPAVLDDLAEAVASLRAAAGHVLDELPEQATDDAPSLPTRTLRTLADGAAGLQDLAARAMLAACLARLPADTRPAPSLARYDELLRGSARRSD